MVNLGILPNFKGRHLTQILTENRVEQNQNISLSQYKAVIQTRQ